MTTYAIVHCRKICDGRRKGLITFPLPAASIRFFACFLRNHSTVCACGRKIQFADNFYPLVFEIEIFQFCTIADRNLYRVLPTFAALFRSFPHVSVFFTLFSDTQNLLVGKPRISAYYGEITKLRTCKPALSLQKLLSHRCI